jgi:hypothetical protein
MQGLILLVLSFVGFCYGLLMLVLKYKRGGVIARVESDSE